MNMELPQLRDCRVLLVDDTRTNLDVLVQALRSRYRLSVATDGPSALAVARRTQPDLILLDIMMPGMDGFQVAERIQQDERLRETPIIFITAMDDTEDKVRGLKAGAVDYITKPFHVAEVRARVRTHLALKVSRLQLRDQNLLLEQKVRERTRELEDTQIDIIDRLGQAAEYHDQDTGEHIRRMSIFCRMLAKEAGLDAEDTSLLWRSSTMHDVGKIGISEAILLKPGRLSRIEWEVMQTHTTIGARLLSGSSSKLLRMAEVIARTHHEKWDGSGYPDGLSGEDIPVAGRITCICDVFDALISDRPYKKAWSIEDALAEIEAGRGVHFDPELTDLFLALGERIQRIAKKLS